MTFRNMMKDRVLAMASPDDQPAVRRFGLDLRKQIKMRNLKETPFLTIRIHKALVSLVRMLRMEQQLMSPKATDADYKRWEEASATLQMAVDEFEAALEKLDKTATAETDANGSLETESQENATSTGDSDPSLGEITPDFDELLKDRAGNDALSEERDLEPCGVS